MQNPIGEIYEICGSKTLGVLGASIHFPRRSITFHSIPLHSTFGECAKRSHGGREEGRNSGRWSVVSGQMAFLLTTDHWPLTTDYAKRSQNRERVQKFVAPGSELPAKGSTLMRIRCPADVTEPEHCFRFVL